MRFTKTTLVLVAFGMCTIPYVVLASNAINWTFYAPGAGGQIEGAFETSYPDTAGKTVPHTLDDVRLGKSQYVTLASATSMRGKWFCIGTVTYASPLDRQMHTLTNVVGYVQDTGCAFNGTCKSLAGYSNGVARPDKMDIAVGNFTGWGGSTASKFVDKNKNTAPATWQQIAGLPSPSAAGSTNGTACNGVPKETGTASPASYRPATVTAADITSPFSNVSMLGSPNVYQASNAYSTPGVGSSAWTSQSTQSTQSNQATQTSTASNNATVSNSNTISNGKTGTAVAQIIAQPSTVVVGSPIIVSWSSAGVSATSPCSVYENTTTLIASKNAGTQVVTPTNAGTFKFSLSCTAQGTSASVLSTASVVAR